MGELLEFVLELVIELLLEVPIVCAVLATLVAWFLCVGMMGIVVGSIVSGFCGLLILIVPRWLGSQRRLVTLGISNNPVR
jgi:amino acid permease